MYLVFSLPGLAEVKRLSWHAQGSFMQDVRKCRVNLTLKHGGAVHGLDAAAKFNCHKHALKQQIIFKLVRAVHKLVNQPLVTNASCDMHHNPKAA